MYSFHVYSYACLITPNVMSFVEPKDCTACMAKYTTEYLRVKIRLYIIVKICAVVHWALLNILCLWCLWIVSRPCDLHLAWHSDFYKCVLMFIELQNHLPMHFWRSTSVCIASVQSVLHPLKFWLSNLELADEKGLLQRLVKNDS